MKIRFYDLHMILDLLSAGMFIGWIISMIGLAGLITDYINGAKFASSAFIWTVTIGQTMLFIGAVCFVISSIARDSL